MPDRDNLRKLHRERQGAIILLLLLGPAPISLILFLMGEGAAALTVVLASTAILVGAMLELYRRQRRDAAACGLPVLAPGQVIAMLLIVAGIAVGTFLLPNPALMSLGLVALIAVIVVTYVMGVRIRRDLSEPDERSVVLVLGLMAALIALANACM